MPDNQSKTHRFQEAKAAAARQNYIDNINA